MSSSDKLPAVRHNFAALLEDSVKCILKHTLYVYQLRTKGILSVFHTNIYRFFFLRHPNKFPQLKLLRTTWYCVISLNCLSRLWIIQINSGSIIDNSNFIIFRSVISYIKLAIFIVYVQKVEKFQHITKIWDTPKYAYLCLPNPKHAAPFSIRA